MLLAHHLHQLVVLQSAVPGNVPDPLTLLSADLAGGNIVHYLDILTEGGLKVASGEVFSLPAVRKHLFTYGAVGMRLFNMVL